MHLLILKNAFRLRTNLRATFQNFINFFYFPSFRVTMLISSVIFRLSLMTDGIVRLNI